MQLETPGNETDELPALIALLNQERGELRARIHLARCGIREEWEKSEAKWRRLRSMNGASPDTARQLARELKDSYVRIYRGLLAKSWLLLDRLNLIGQEADSVALENLRRQAAFELEAFRRRLETLGGAEPPGSPPADEPVCGCLKCVQEKSRQAFNPDRLPAAAGPVPLIPRHSNKQR